MSIRNAISLNNTSFFRLEFSRSLEDKIMVVLIRAGGVASKSDITRGARLYPLAQRNDALLSMVDNGIIRMHRDRNTRGRAEMRFQLIKWPDGILPPVDVPPDEPEPYCQDVPPPEL